MTQAERIIEFMEQNGSITSMDAFNYLGITKLTTRISEMRASGMDIDGVMEKRKNRFGESVRFMRYTLVKE